MQILGCPSVKVRKKQPEYNAETMETNLKHVYLAGVVCGGMNTHVWFIENSREHAVKIIRKIEQDLEKREVPRLT